MSDFWTPERDTILRQGYANGLKIERIANALGATPSTITGRARRLGISQANPKTKRGYNAAPTHAEFNEFEQQERAKIRLAHVKFLEPSKYD